MKVNLIAAVSDPGMIIGNDGDLPWPRLPADMKFFKQMTDGQPVIIGRKTWDSIPRKFRPLSNRHNVVLTRHNVFPAVQGAYYYKNIDGILADLRHYKEAWVIGGGNVYKQFLERRLVNKMYITKVKGEFTGDVKFPDINWDEWNTQILHSSFYKDIYFEFWCYERKNDEIL